MSSFRKLQRLSASERRLLTQALLLLPLTFWGIYALGVSRWQRFLARLASLGTTPNLISTQTDGTAVRSSRDAGGEATEQAQVIARVVKIAAEQGVYRAKCLQQTLVLWYLLRRNHIESEIRFGARKKDGELQAHAWVEMGGVALNEDSDVCLHFSPLQSDTGQLSPEVPGGSRSALARVL